METLGALCELRDGKYEPYPASYGCIGPTSAYLGGHMLSFWLECTDGGLFLLVRWFPVPLAGLVHPNTRIYRG